MITVKHATIDRDEVAQFSRLAQEWWAPDGPFRPLHRMNPVRLDFLRLQLCGHFGRDLRAPRPFEGLRMVDVGCGGGLLSEPLARLGAEVTGIDASEDGIKAARLHAGEMGLDIDYRCIAAEELAAEGARFDAVLALEIVEHVADRAAFASALAGLIAPGGLVVLSTLNRTPKSYALAIVGAEYIFGWLPRGTHDWHRFPTPAELESELDAAGLTVLDSAGFGYDPLRDDWRIGDDLSVNYAMVAEIR